MKGSLKSKILLGFTATVAFTTLVSVVVAYINFQSMQRETVRIGSVNLTASLVNDITNQLKMVQEPESLSRFSHDLSRIVESASMVDSMRILSDDLVVVASPNLAESGKKIPGELALHEAILGVRNDVRIVTLGSEMYGVVPVQVDDPPVKVYIVVSFKPEFLTNSRWSMIMLSIFGASIALILAAVATYLMFRKLIETPLNEISFAFRRVKRGELDVALPEFDTEEFSQTGRSISDLFSALRAASTGLQSLVRLNREQTDKIRAMLGELGNVDQQTKLHGSELDVIRGGLMDTVRRAEQTVTRLHSFSEDTSSSVLQMLSSLEEVDEQMHALNRILEDTLTRSAQMNEGFSEVTSNTQELAHESDGLASSISEIIQSIQLVEQHAATNRDLSQRVAEQAREGSGAIQRSSEGMQQIKESVNQMNDVIQVLGLRTQEIESILKAINQIAEKTNLLALNAAIIAAQAGEHGRSFGVVADEIRELAAQTTSSTRDIAEKVGSVQNETSKVIEKMNQSLDQVGSGEKLLNETVTTLRSILQSSHDSDQMSQTIAVATVEQAKVSRQIGEVANRIQSYLHQIAQSMKNQQVSTNQLAKGSNQIRDLSISVQRASQEQRDVVSRLNSHVESVLDLSNSLRDDARSSGASATKLDELHAAGLQLVDKQQKLHAEIKAQFDVLSEAARRTDLSLEFLTAASARSDSGDSDIPTGA